MHTSSGGRGALFVAMGLAALLCVPFWSLPYFPTQDGPAHLNTSAILSWYGSVPQFQRYFVIRWNPAGNALTEALCAALIRIADPVTAERWILTLYALLFPLAIRFALGHFSRHPDLFAVLSLPFASNYFLHMGFWNFLYGVLLFFFGIGVYFRVRGRAAKIVLPALAMLYFAVFSANVIAFGALAVVIAAFAALDVFRSGPPHGLLRSWTPLIVAALAAVPTAATFLAWQIGSNSGVARIARPHPLWIRLRTLFGMTFAAGYGDHETPLLALTVAGFALLALAALRRRLRDRKFQPADVFLAAAGLFAAMGVAGPEYVGVADALPIRFDFFAWACVFCWLAAQPWTSRARSILCMAAVLLACAQLAARYPAYSRYSRQIEEVDEIASHLPPGAVYTSIDLDATSSRIFPLMHAADLLGLRPAVNLNSYQAASSAFCVQYRFAPDRDSAGYILVHGLRNEPSPGNEHFGALVAASRAGHFRLYRRDVSVSAPQRGT